MLPKIDEYREYYFETVKKLLDAPSPSGYYREVMSVVKTLAEENGCHFSLTHKGCAVLTYPGKNHDAPLGACAHCDTLGAMVRSVDGGGGLNFTVVGGPILPTLDGEYCTVITRDGKKYQGTFLSRSPAVHVYRDAASRPRDCENMYVRLDEVVKSAEEVKNLGIRNGDYICIDPKTVVTDSGFLKSRFIDDKASVAALLTACHVMKAENYLPEQDICLLITMYEEVGHGASYVPEGLVSMLGVDMGCVGDDLACTEYDVSICAKDSHGPYDYALTSSLISLAEESGLSYAVDVYPFYGSDVGAMWSAGYDVPGALIGSGVHASHGMERTHWQGIANTLLLTLLYFGMK